MKCFALLPLFILSLATQLSAQNPLYYSMLNDSIRKSNDEKFRNPETSPLPPEEITRFAGLEYFPFDTNFIVRAEFVRTPWEKPFKMTTTTSRRPEYVKYGEARFCINGDSLRLSIYRNLELAKKPLYKDYFFLPFTDSTSGFDTYGGGRYLDLNIPEDTHEEIILDFNQSYHPYCAYNDRYSCPVPPPENFLNIRISAGIKSTR
jgi:uncharacterized protein (DUF1684 family)